MSSQHSAASFMPKYCPASLVAKNLLPRGVVQRTDSLTDALGAILSGLASARTSFTEAQEGASGARGGGGHSEARSIRSEVR